MAKLLFTAIVADMRNKLNGTVFSKNRYGAYARTKVTPVNPQTSAQQAARGNLAAMSQAWRGITESERQSWINGAANFPQTDIFGNSKILSGQALFVKLNTVLLYNGSSQLDSCPAPIAVPAMTALGITAAEGTPALSVSFGPSPVPADFVIQLQYTPNVPPGVNFVKNKFRLADAVSPAGTTPHNGLSAFTNAFGAPVAGNKIFVKAYMVSLLTGQTGVPLQAQCIVAA
jgi:hypothetical protein